MYVRGWSGIIKGFLKEKCSCKLQINSAGHKLGQMYVCMWAPRHLRYITESATERTDQIHAYIRGRQNTQNALVSPVTGVLRLHPTCLCATRHLCAAQQQMARPGTAGNYDSTSCDQRDQIGCRRSDSDICVSRRWHARRCWAESDGHYVGRSGASVSSWKTLLWAPP